MTNLIWTGMALLTLATAAISAPRADATVSIKTFKFRPDTVLVRTGVAVTWTNDDEIEHTVTSDSAGPSRAKLDGALNGKGATYRASFTKPGVYAYHCDRHQFMRGVVRVTSPGEQP